MRAALFWGLCPLKTSACWLQGLRRRISSRTQAHRLPSLTPFSPSRLVLSPVLQVKEYELKKGNFSKLGHFGFGISEHIDLGVKYDPATGIFGMDFYVVLGRAGFRVSRRKHATSRVGASHRITKDEAQKWFTQKFEGILSA